MNEEYNTQLGMPPEDPIMGCLIQLLAVAIAMAICASLGSCRTKHIVEQGSVELTTVHTAQQSSVAASDNTHSLTDVLKIVLSDTGDTLRTDRHTHTTDTIKETIYIKEEYRDSIPYPVYLTKTMIVDKPYIPTWAKVLYCGTVLLAIILIIWLTLKLRIRSPTNA